MSIPKNITKEHIDRAINEISINDIPKGRLSNTYFLISGEKRLPPKFVLGEANKYANNTRESINSFTNDIDEALAKAVGSLSGTVEQLEESLADWMDVIEKNRNGKRDS